MGWFSFLGLLLGLVTAQTNPPFMSLLDTVPGPQALAPSHPDYNDSLVRVCVPHVQLTSAVRLYITPVLTNVYPTKTAKLYYTGVLEAADRLFTAKQSCDFGLFYSMSIPRLVHDGVLRPLNPDFTKFQKRFGFSPHNNMPPQSFNDLYINGQWYAIPHMFQNLAVSLNRTTAQALGLDLPPPLATAPWDWETFARYVDTAYYDGLVEEPYISEPCMIGQALIASGLDVGVSLIDENGKCGWRDPRFIEVLVKVWMKLMANKPRMVARWLDLNQPITQAYMTTPSEQWPPSRTFWVPRGTCTLATQAHFLTVLYAGSRPEMQAIYSPGSSNTIQTWGFGLFNDSSQPDVAWEFLSYMIDCENPPMLNLIVNVTRQIPAFEHCIELPVVRAMMDARPSLQRTFAERRKSFPVTHPIPPFPNVYRYENDSIHLILLAEIWKGGLLPTDNLTEFMSLTPYNQLQTRWGKGGIHYPNSPMFDAYEVAVKAADRACRQLEYIMLPDCVFPTNTLYRLDDCDKDVASARVIWNPDHVDTICLVTEFAKAQLQQTLLARPSECPYVRWNSSVGTGVAVLVALGLVAATLTTGGWFWFQDRFRQSSIGLTFILIGGVYMLYFAPITLMEGSCGGYYILTSLGVATTNGALLMKQYRLDNIFLSTKLKVKRLSEWKMMVGAAIVMAINTVMWIVWDVIRGDDKVLQPVEQFGDGTVIIPVAQCNHGPVGVLSIWGCLYLILCGLTSRYGWRLRRLKGQYADGQFVAYSNTVMSLVVLFIVLFAMMTTLARQLTVVLLFAPFIVATTILLTYFVSRFTGLCKDIEESDGSGIEMTATSPVPSRHKSNSHLPVKSPAGERKVSDIV